MREDRQKIWDEYEGDKPPHLKHPWLDYDRYRYADKIIATLNDHGEDFNKLSVLDYGCGVADYGFSFGRKGATVIFYDNRTYINFVRFRLEKEPVQFRHHLIEIKYDVIFPEGINVVIFGEVLEHLESPLQVITRFVNQKVKYIFTSSYPFRNDNPKDDYWNHPGHEHDTWKEQPACRDLLFANYERVRYNGEASLWIRK